VCVTADCVMSGCSGVGHYDCVSRLTLVDGDIKNENIVFISSRADTALAVSGQLDVEITWKMSKKGMKMK